MGFELPEEELDINISQDEDNCFIARIFHRPTSTIKISEPLRTAELAFEDAIQGLKDLVQEKKKGLGN